MNPVLFVFLDGVGLGEADAAFNPFFRADLPVWRELLGGEPPYAAHPLIGQPATLDPAESVRTRASGSGSDSADRSPMRSIRLFPLDATLGVSGLPQSGTGQIALLTGRNAPQLFGRHFGPWPPVSLRPLLEEENLLVRLRRSGRSVRFANAYPERYPEGVSSRRVAATALAAHMAGVLTSGPMDLVRGEALASEIDNGSWRRFSGRRDIPRISPHEAGGILARISAASDFTFFAHYATDTAGHRGGMTGSVQSLERVDAFLGGVLEGLDPSAILLIAGDHGNVEDTRAGHTLNPALAMAIGPPSAVSRLPELGSLTDLAPAILEMFV